MKAYLLFILLICTSLQAQTTQSKSAGNQIDYFKSNPNDLKDGNGNSIFNSNVLDTVIFTGEATGNYFGYSVSDVNGDGYDDEIY